MANVEAGAGSGQAAQRPAKVRDIRLDLFRGLALLVIVVVHMGGNPLVELMPSHFGFSSGTEMFVFCSGIASGLAFGSLFIKRGFVMGTLRVAHRLWQLYWAHLATFVAVLAVCVFLSRWLGDPAIFKAMQQDVFLADPVRGIAALVTLSYLPPLFDILPLYIVLLAMIPLVMAARSVSKTLPFILVGALYIYTWTVGFSLPASPVDASRVWLFNPLGWQLVFFAGFFIAMGWVKVPAPGTPWAVTASLVVVLVSIPLSWSVLHQSFGLLSYLREMILPASERTNFHLLRFIHFMAVAYLAISALAAFPRVVETKPAKVLAATGRETLAAFLVSIPVAVLSGTVLQQLGTAPRIVVPATILSWAAVIVAAYVSSYVKSRPWSRPAEPRAREAVLAIPTPLATPIPARAAVAVAR